MAAKHNDPDSGARRLDLEEIEGLGSASAEKLRTAGIHSVAELSDFRNPADLHEFLRSHGVPISLDRIMNRSGHKGNWVTQARRHHARTWVVDFTADRAEDPPAWTTTVSSEQLGIEQPFSGTDPATWARWILERSVLPVPGHPGEPAEPTGGHDADTVAGGVRAVAAEENQLAVVMVDVVELDGSGEHLGDELEARIEVNASGPAVAAPAEPTPYCRLEVVAVHEDSGEPLLLGSTVERLARGDSTHSATVAFRAPDVGAYRLVCLGYCFVPALRLGSAEGPRLTVVERSSTTT